MLKRSHSKNCQIWGAAVLVLSLCCGCSAGNQATNQTETQPASSQAETVANPSNGKPKVVASYSVLCDLTEQIATSNVDLNCLIDPDQDPHTYQATPEDRKAIETAQLILYAGYDFDSTIINLVKASKNSAPKIAVHEQAVPNSLMGEENHHGESEHEHAHEDSAENTASEEKTPDPHVWHDAENGIRMVKLIRDQLQKIAPDNQELIARNAQQLTDELRQVDTWIETQINTIPPHQRKLVTTHDALGYYANAYGLTIKGALQGFSTEEQPTPARLRELVTEVKRASVPTIFAEVTANDKVIGTVAREANVKISDRELYADGLGSEESKTGTYVGMLTNNTCIIVNGLGGKCTPFAAKATG